LGTLIHIAGALASASIRRALLSRQPRPSREPRVTRFDVLALLRNRRDAVMSCLQLAGRMPHAGFAEMWRCQQDAPLTALTDDFLPGVAEDAAATGLRGASSVKGADHSLGTGIRSIMAFHLVFKRPLTHCSTLAAACDIDIKGLAHRVVLYGIWSSTLIACTSHRPRLGSAKLESYTSADITVPFGTKTQITYSTVRSPTCSSKSATPSPSGQTCLPQAEPAPTPFTCPGTR
jgi:hypothetical protein